MVTPGTSQTLGCVRRAYPRVLLQRSPGTASTATVANARLTLHMPIATRMDPGTRAYVERRAAEGMHPPRYPRVCLKRYLAREVYLRLNATARSVPTT